VLAMLAGRLREQYLVTFQLLSGWEQIIHKVVAFRLRISDYPASGPAHSSRVGIPQGEKSWASVVCSASTASTALPDEVAIQPPL
jgi:hypothetical protein